MNNTNEPKQSEIPIDDDKHIGKLKPRVLETEMQESYLAYAMSVIVARALPDVRDGLKPVHRRVLYAMHELGLKPGTKYRKSATVVGDVLGKYHPHGDVAVYDTMVRLAQPFAMRYTMVDGQGNFGSMDGDSAAAMRYTEARLAKISDEMLSDIDKNTVDFVDNYDATRKEPAILPAKVPQLLLNGTIGIAVGMATTIPPHNLSELADGITALIENPDLTTEDLMEYIKGPDFPTGGIVYGTESIKGAYGTGRGKIIIRAVANIEEHKNGKFRIVVSEIPYQVNKAELIAKIAELVKLKKVEGITDLRDESDRKSGVRIVIELKQNAYPKKVLNKLYQFTNLQTSFHFNMLALVNGIQPKTLTLKDILDEFIKHRKLVVTRRTQFELDRAKERAHILEGLKKALDHIDEVITTIRESETKDIAYKNLIAKFGFSDAQTTAILEMKLSTLAGLERKKIEDELAEKLKIIAELTAILASEAKILGIVKDELAQTKEKYHDERRTKIMPGGITEFSVEDLVPNEQVIVTITKDNYIKRVPVSIYRAQKRGGKGKTGMDTKESDSILQLLVAMTHDNISFFTNYGRVFNSMVHEIPASGRQAKGQALVNFLQLKPDEKVTTALCFTGKKETDEKYLFMTTEQGVVKKTPIEQFKNIRKSGLICIKLQDKDRLNWVFATNGSNEISIVTRSGQSVHFNESEVRPMGRSAGGVRGIKLRTEDAVISTDVIQNEQAEIFTISEHGYGKRTPIGEFTLQKRGGIGLRAAKVSPKTGKLVSSKVIYSTEGDAVVVSKKGIVLRTALSSVKKLGRDTQGVRIIKPNDHDEVASMTVFTNQLEDEEEKQPDNAQESLLDVKKNDNFKPYVKAQTNKKEIKSSTIVSKHLHKTQIVNQQDDSAKQTKTDNKNDKKIDNNYWAANTYKK